MIHVSWRYFERSGDPEGYLLYRALSNVNQTEQPESSGAGASWTDDEADGHDSQNDRSGDSGD